MSLQDANAWFGILGGAAGVLATLYVAVDSWRRGRKKRIDEASVVTTNAIQLMEQLRAHARELEEQLDDVSGKLIAANDRADALKRGHEDMANKLADAQAEVRILRGQVKMLSAELDKGGDCPEGAG